MLHSKFVFLSTILFVGEVSFDLLDFDSDEPFLLFFALALVVFDSGVVTSESGIGFCVRLCFDFLPTFSSVSTLS
jgi:hypothetical protein